MSIGEEQTECPLCMEPLEMDDINFFPCTCGYQICRFCWHRIRTDENGLCPACRKQYPEDPAEFKPLTEDELQRIKKERRQKDLQRKQKAAENRKHLANVRVVQKNLVFVVGLSQRLADTEVLKKAEYFGKFGKIHKVVINHSTSYAGAQGPSASAYVTYNRPEDALRAIQAVNNIYVDGRTLKASLGTTKYCSHFLRGAQCPKPDCMYLHELGEEAASFTKEEMQQGKHQEYEQKLYEMFMNSQNLSNHPSAPLTPPVATTPPPTPPAVVGPTPIVTTSTNTNTSKSTSRKKASSPQNIPQSVGILGHHPVSNSKEGWPSLGTSNGSPLPRPERLTNGNRSTPPGSSSSSSHSPPLSDSTPPPPGVSTFKQDTQNAQNRAPGHNRTKSNTDPEQLNNSKSKGKGCIQNQRQQQQHQTQQQTNLHSHHTSQQIVPPHLPSAQLPTQAPPGVSVSPHTIPTHTTPPPGLPPYITQPPPQIPVSSVNPATGTRKSPFDIPNSMSLFSDIGFSGMRNPKPSVSPHLEETLPAAEIPDTIPVSSSTDWQAAFGFTSAPYNTSIVDHIPQSLNNDDDLGFDPWDESTKALADLIEKEGGMGFMGNHNFSQAHVQNHSNVLSQQHVMDNQPKNLPPGFSPNHLGAYNGNLPQMGFTGSKMLGLMQFPAVVHSVHAQNAFHDVLTDVALSHPTEGTPQQQHPQQPQQQPQQQQPQQVQPSQNDVFNMKDWQDGLRALLPNINISFGAPPSGNPTTSSSSSSSSSTHNTSAPHSATKNSCSSDLTWDPAIVTSGNVTDSMSLSEDTPHWMASLQHLTDDSTNHRLPFLQQLPFTGTPAWAAQTAQHPPPGFHAATNTLHHSLPTQDNTQSQQPLAAAAGEGLQ